MSETKRERLEYLLLMVVVGMGIVFNNLVRWFPFPPGRSQNDVTGIDSNLLGIIVNTVSYAAILIILLFSRADWRISLHSGLILAYVAYVLTQTILRTNLAIELVRSVALGVMVIAADQFGKWLVGNPERLIRCMRVVWLCLVGTVWFGILIGLVLRDSVNWGNGLSPSYLNQIRAEFFFFHILPYPTVALSLWILMDRSNRRSIRWLGGVSLFVILILAVLTMTRSIVFSNFLVVAIFSLRYSRGKLAFLIFVLLILALLMPDLVDQIALRLRIDTLLAGNLDVDFTNSRSDSYAINFNSFAESPILGLGGEMARQRVLEGDTLAKSEYGYTIHLAAYGLFSAFFFSYVLWGVWASVRLLLRPKPRFAPQLASLDRLATAVAVVALASAILGFIWIFGSGTAFFDWLPLVFVSLAVGMWTRRRNLFGQRLSQVPVDSDHVDHRELARQESLHSTG